MVPVVAGSVNGGYGNAHASRSTTLRMEVMLKQASTNMCGAKLDGGSGQGSFPAPRADIHGFKPRRVDRQHQPANLKLTS